MNNHAQFRLWSSKQRFGYVSLLRSKSNASIPPATVPFGHLYTSGMDKALYNRCRSALLNMSKWRIFLGSCSQITSKPMTTLQCWMLNITINSLELRESQLIKLTKMPMITFAYGSMEHVLLKGRFQIRHVGGGGGFEGLERTPLGRKKNFFRRIVLEWRSETRWSSCV